MTTATGRAPGAAVTAVHSGWQSLRELPRPDRAVVRGRDVDGTPLVVEGIGRFARLLPHETDRLGGHVRPDRLSKRDRRDVLRQMTERHEVVFAPRAGRVAELGPVGAPKSLGTGPGGDCSALTPRRGRSPPPGAGSGAPGSTHARTQALHAPARATPPCPRRIPRRATPSGPPWTGR
ncbi:peptide deformylase [Streptomyces sp. NPDC004008]